MPNLGKSLPKDGSINHTRLNPIREGQHLGIPTSSPKKGDSEGHVFYHKVRDACPTGWLV
jgi:hypothetical protein